MAYDWSELPAWYKRPAPEPMEQCHLFAASPDALQDILARLTISGDDLTRWHEQGLVSFDLAIRTPIEPWHLNELRFVRDVVRSGLSDAQIGTLLEKLPRPMNFDPAQVAYSFSLGWVQAIPPTEPDVSDFMTEHFEEWLEELAETDPNRLTALRNQVDDVIASNVESENERTTNGVEPERDK